MCSCIYLYFVSFSSQTFHCNTVTHLAKLQLNDFKLQTEEVVHLFLTSRQNLATVKKSVWLPLRRSNNNNNNNNNNTTTTQKQQNNNTTTTMIQHNNNKNNNTTQQQQQ